MAQEVARERLGVCSGVEDFVGCDSPERAGDHVAHRVPSGAGGRYPRLGKSPNGELDVSRPHEVELEVLAGRDVPEAPGEAGRGVGQGAQLVGRHGSLRKLDPQHVDSVLPLPVDASSNSVGAPGVGIDLAALEATEILDEGGDLRLVGKARDRLVRRR